MREIASAAQPSGGTASLPDYTPSFHPRACSPTQVKLSPYKKPRWPDGRTSDSIRKSWVRISMHYRFFSSKSLCAHKHNAHVLKTVRKTYQSNVEVVEHAYTMNNVKSNLSKALISRIKIRKSQSH